MSYALNVRFAEGVNWRLAGKEVDMQASCSRSIESIKRWYCKIHRRLRDW